MTVEYPIQGTFPTVLVLFVFYDAEFRSDNALPNLETVSRIAGQAQIILPRSSGNPLLLQIGAGLHVLLHSSYIWATHAS